jgi:hypothetical protein
MNHQVFGNHPKGSLQNWLVELDHHHSLHSVVYSSVSDYSCYFDAQMTSFCLSFFSNPAVSTPEGWVGLLREKANLLVATTISEMVEDYINPLVADSPPPPGPLRQGRIYLGPQAPLDLHRQS